MSARTDGPLRLATRRSPLATAQSTWVADQIRLRCGRPVELVPVVTEGDRSREPLTQIGGTGVFVAAVRDAVRTGAADLAVHSCKDLPTAGHPDLVLAAVPPRETVAEAFVSDGTRFTDLPAGARVGTGSPRRAAQVRARRPDLQVVDIRGNVETRLAMVDSGELAAVILALAGLTRLGLAQRAVEVWEPDVMLPAPGQGALAVECRAADDATAALLRALDDVAARTAITAERQLLATLEAGCSAPIGAHAVVTADSIRLTAGVWGPTAASYLTTQTGAAAAPEDLGRRAAQALVAAGADQLVGGATR